MVVISAGLVTKNRRILLARQFLEISKGHIEGLLNSFVRMIDPNVQHTFIENESARFVYLPFEDLYLVLTTSKDSNIVEDLETLRLLSKIIQHYCPFGLDEGNILKNSFEIVWAFDDVISQGYRESITLGQMLTYCEMESAEEKLHKEKQKAMMQEAKELAKRKQSELDKKRAVEDKERKRERRSVQEEPEYMTKPEIPSIPSPTVIENSIQNTQTTQILPKKPTKGMVLATKGKKNRGDA
ncbi:unnamed protein product [Blepharisma stoltei]|uniref:Coatomer subunit delta n=1 Tax=Blepharisma stoltei TaxID=1481888 RepID=A0AAU9J172_9CILI|nr:unnamed protein product [Blepharisma stoltei]